MSAINGLVAGGCHFQTFSMGSKPFRSIFLRFLEPRKNRNFDGDVLSISTDNRNLTDISIKISEVLFPAHTSRVTKTLATPLFQIGTKQHFKLGRLVFDNILRQTESSTLNLALAIRHSSSGFSRINVPHCSFALMRSMVQHLRLD